MSVIFIPSKKIYNYDNDKVPNNIINSVEQSLNKSETVFGNVLSKEYTFNYLSEESDGSFTKLYTNSLYTEGFQFSEVAHGVSAELTFTIDKPSIYTLETDENGNTRFTSHRLKIVSQYYRPYNDDGLLPTETTTLEQPIIKDYDKDKGTIKFEYRRTISNNLWGKILSETLSFVGNYVTFTEEVEKIGDGDADIIIPNNELIQSANDNLLSFSRKIVSNYSNGKEIVKIKCSISEYIDDGGEVAIDPKTSTKMLFEHYDKVIPMVRNEYGKDEPISYDSSNLAKVFQVIGVKVYYDGAVWQELTLEESNESANIQTQLPDPTIRIADDILYIQDGSGLGKSFQIYVDGNAQVITDSKTYPISNIPSITQGSHRIYVVSLGYGNYTSSGASNVVTYMMDIKGGYLTFVGEDGEVTLSAFHLWDGQVYISTDAQNWSEWNGESISSVDSKIYLRGRNNTTMRGNSVSVQAVLRVSGSATKVACYGNIANLLDYTKVSSGKTKEIIMAEACFQYLFLSQTKLTRCPEMPLTTLSKGCYQEMYRGCTQLATLPKLPATTLLDSCYASMFYGCTSIKLSATKSDEYSNEYRIPTEGNISNAPATSRYNMFANTGGTFAPTGNANILNNIIYTANEIV